MPRDDYESRDRDGDRHRDKHGKPGWMNGRTLMIVAVVVVVAIIVFFVIWWMTKRAQFVKPLPAPTGLAVVTKGTTTTLTWNAVPTAQAYNIYIASSSGVTTAATKVRVDGPQTTASLTLKPGIYFFAVSALTFRDLSDKSKDDTRESGLSNEVNTKTPNCPNANLSPPTTLNAEVLGGGQVELEWPGVLDAAAYNVYRAQSRPVTTKDYDQLYRSDSTAVLFTELTSETKQSFLVTTVDACNNETAPSAVVTVMVDCKSPDSPEISSVTPNANTITVKWGGVSNAVSYTAYIKKGTSVSPQNNDAFHVLDASLQSITFTGLQTGTTYAVGVAATNACGESRLNVAATTTTGNASTAKGDAATQDTKKSGKQRGRDRDSGASHMAGGAAIQSAQSKA